MLAWPVMYVAMVLAGHAGGAPQLQLSDIHYQVDKQPHVPMQDYLVVHTLDNFGFDFDKSGGAFEAIMYKKYGPECSKRVIASMHSTVQCVKRQLDLGSILSGGGLDLQAIRSGNPAAMLCRMADLHGVLGCAEQLQQSGKLSCTHDQLIKNEARTIAALARAALHLCRDDGALLDRGLSQLQTCDAQSFQRYSGGLGDCQRHFTQLMQQQGASGPGALADSLQAVHNVSRSCPALVRLSQCLPPALGHCSPLLREISTDALREVVFYGLCVDVLQEPAVLEAVDEFGQANYCCASSMAVSLSHALLAAMLAVVAALSRL